MSLKSLIYKIDNRPFVKVLELLVKMAEEGGKTSFVVTVNPELIMLAAGDTHYNEVLQSADLALADGIGIVWAGIILGKPFNGRAHGVDIVEKFSQAVADLPAGRQEKPITVGFLGGKGNVAEQTANCLKKKYPGLKVAFALEEWPGYGNGLQSTDYSKSSTTVDSRQKTVSLKCDMLFVAFGSPKQELWIKENINKIEANAVMGVGGAFDFISGKVPRAPLFIRKMGLEWLFRLVIQPWRLKRQLALVKFVIAVLKEKTA